MPSTIHVSKPGTGHIPAGMLVLLLVLSVAFAPVLPVAKAYAAGGTTLGILVIDSGNGQTAGKDGTTKLGIRVTNSKEPIDINYAITLDLNGAPGTNPEVIVTYNLPLPKVTPPSRTGYTFVGYFDGANTKYYNSTGDGLRVWDKTANEPLFAHWKANKYTVSFDSNDGAGGQTADVEATYDAAMPTISSTPPSRTGYRFAGWFDAKEGGNLYYDANGVSKANWDKDTAYTLYAHWTLQITFKFPTAALIEVDASGNVTGKDLDFESTTPEDIKVTAVKSTRSESATSLFVDDTTLKGVRILLKPTTGGADSEVKVPLTVSETSLPANWTIAANTNLAVAFNLSLPSGAQLNFLANDGQVSIANLSYEVSAASISS
ncbi:MULTISPECIES: InlB B-repeat-containing protein [Gordonibacter]|uniref:InlB B-repeat-containing protein n=1 Tax=Gordonibacter faecis TaxID=3047475 RepID=A0ABT7DPE6_9ACTN|nr:MULTISPECIES: InlB B-repeat-containing protein [unclassified Gordonibacter]MDJ1651413.1 InlB B-repeat-containing protein [Gordonibacter sp. KGMB12511]HIW76005.1 InlB B-repeat-containing protein [Candidatus Gordonibacter avicola]